MGDHIILQRPGDRRQEGWQAPRPLSGACRAPRRARHRESRRITTRITTPLGAGHCQPGRPPRRAGEHAGLVRRQWPAPEGRLISWQRRATCWCWAVLINRQSSRGHLACSGGPQLPAASCHRSTNRSHRSSASLRSARCHARCSALASLQLQLQLHAKSHPRRASSFGPQALAAEPRPGARELRRARAPPCERPLRRRCCLALSGASVPSVPSVAALR